MAYYDALAAKWATLSGSTDEKLAAINAEMVAGPRVDVQISSVMGELMLSGAFLPLASFAGGNPTGDSAHDNALFAAKMLMTLVTSPNAPAFNLADSGRYATITGMLNAIVSYEAAHPGATGMTANEEAALLALSATTLPWWQSVGYSSPIGIGDLESAGLK